MNESHKKAFTMIELIFVIVIIGILAAVALSRLAATRDDAHISRIIANSRIVFGDLGAYYTSQGGTHWQDESISKATSVALKDSNCAVIDPISTQIGPTVFALCDDTEACLTFTTEDEGNLTVAASAGVSSKVCIGVQTDKAIVGILKEHALGGSVVVK